MQNPAECRRSHSVCTRDGHLVRDKECVSGGPNVLMILTNDALRRYGAWRFVRSNNYLDNDCLRLMAYILGDWNMFGCFVFM